MNWFLLLALITASGWFAPLSAEDAILARPGSFHSLTEPPCSYCVNEGRKNVVKPDDRVLAWVRGDHNGGAFPLRFFIAGPRVINDTYGLFFYDPDGGYVAAYKKDYGYEFYGWRKGTMIVKGRDGSLWSALSGEAIEGPKKGEKLQRVPSMLSTWSYWLMLHPESTAYDLFDGRKYSAVDLPTQLTQDAKESMGNVDPRLDPMSMVLGLEGKAPLAVPLRADAERVCFMENLDGQSVVVFYFKQSDSAIAYKAAHNGKQLTFYADNISPETAPFKDKETGTRWSLAGRGIDGPLKGQELEWVPSIHCRWYAWAANYPQTALGGANISTANLRP